MYPINLLNQSVITDTLWFSNPTGLVGIVLVQTLKGPKAYVGKANLSGEQEDAVFIYENGGKLTEDQIGRLVSHFNQHARDYHG